MRQCIRLLCAVAAVLTAVIFALPAGADDAYDYREFSFQSRPRKVIGVRYSGGGMRSAMPLGGLGTGTVYFTGKGTFEGNALCNTYRPAGGLMPGCFFAFRTHDGNRSASTLLQMQKLDDLPTVEGIDYLGHFPFADVSYEDADVPLQVSLRAASPFIPKDSALSGIPAAMFRFRVANPTDRTVNASLGFAWDCPAVSAWPGLLSRGNVDGYLVWSLGDLKPGAFRKKAFVYTVADSEDGIRSRLAALRKLGNGFMDKADAKAGQGPCTLKSEATDFVVDPTGMFHWEDEHAQCLRFRGKPNLSQHGFCVFYERGGKATSAGHRVSGVKGTRLHNVKVVTATGYSAMREGCLTRLASEDGSVTIRTGFRLGWSGAEVLQVFWIENACKEILKNVRIALYANLEADHSHENDVGRLSKELGALLAVDPGNGTVAALAGWELPDGGWCGTWGSTLGLFAKGKHIPFTEWKSSAELASGLERVAGSTPQGLFYTARRPSDESGCSIAALSSPGAKLRLVDHDSPQHPSHSFWPSFYEGAGAETSADRRLKGGNGLGLAVDVEVPPGQSREVRFILSWYYPDALDSAGRFVGHEYANRFSGSRDVAETVARRWDDLWNRTAAWQELVYDADVPGWLKDVMVNSLYVMVRNSAWIKDGRFTQSESYRGCPITETIVCRFYGSIPLAMMFPDLERNTMRQFMRHQRADGAIPFGFGRPELWDSPYYETQQSLDSSEFVLMAYRDYVWWGDREWAKEVYPAVKRAIGFAQTLDKDGDGVINDEVSMQYYDCWQFSGVSTYVGTVWLAALRAGEELAKVNGDDAFAKDCRQWFEKAQATVEEKLWTGSYYRLYNDTLRNRRSDTCLGNQLVGQWYAYLCGLGEILPKEHVLGALRHVGEVNGTNSPFGLVNGITPDGKRDMTGRNGHSSTITIGETWCYAATCIYAGVPDLGMPIAERLARNIALRQRSPWNTTWNMDPDSGRMLWGTEYYSNMCVWDLWGALLGKRSLE